MKSFSGICASVLILGLFASSAVGAGDASGEPPQAPPDSTRTIYQDNPHISVGAVRLDITGKVTDQIPEGWRAIDTPGTNARPDSYRLVKFSGPVGGRQRRLLEAAGYDIVSYHPYNSFLVRSRPGLQAATFTSIEGVRWNGPFHPYFKIDEPLAASPPT